MAVVNGDFMVIYSALINCVGEALQKGLMLQFPNVHAIFIFTEQRGSTISFRRGIRL